MIALLARLESAELAECFHVVGTHALYAYETVAGVRFDANVTATRDIDLLWDVRKRMNFWTQMERLDSSFLALLKKVDSSSSLKCSSNSNAGYLACQTVNLSSGNEMLHRQRLWRLCWMKSG